MRIPVTSGLFASILSLSLNAVPTAALAQTTSNPAPGDGRPGTKGSALPDASMAAPQTGTIRATGTGVIDQSGASMSGAPDASGYDSKGSSASGSSAAGTTGDAASGAAVPLDHAHTGANGVATSAPRPSDKKGKADKQD